MLSKIFNHVTHRYFNRFHLLTIGWSDGATFIPVDFSLVAKGILSMISKTVLIKEE